MNEFEVLLGALAGGFVIALTVTVITASIRAGWQYWAWILGLGFLAYILF